MMIFSSGGRKIRRNSLKTLVRRSCDDIRKIEYLLKPIIATY